MPRPILSVIVAAYNVEAYIEATLESIDRQTADLTEVEFIIVDDGSTDSTASFGRQVGQQKAQRYCLFSGEPRCVRGTSNCPRPSKRTMDYFN
ncbi:glycosyltransferase family 2 protein [Glutamicibacter halophytocola]|uniref:glycosyltransferase family 2 protein n=1 Tax=Glutamicibacter halophytocola TaxID=1933880 RepID=UPI003D273681